MIFYFTFTFNILISKVIDCQSSNFYPALISFEFPQGPEISYGRYRRDDKLRHTAVCGELDHTEDTPFVAVIITRNPGRLLCMGSIIDEYHVLTAKRCFYQVDASALMIIGGYKSPHFGRNSQVKFANRIVKHEKELAIIKLEKPFRFTTTVKAIRLIGPEKMEESDVNKTYPDPYGIVGYDIPNKLIERTEYLPKISIYEMRDERFTDCNKKCIELEKNDESLHFCSNISSLFGWSALGSPVVIIQEKEYIQIGVLWAWQCEEKKKKKRDALPGKRSTNNTNFTESESMSSNGSEPENTESRQKPGDPAPAEPEKDKKEPDLYYHIRTDKYYKWIKANSYIGR